MSDAQNNTVLNTQITDAREQQANGCSTPHPDEKKQEMHCLPRKVIPIIFLPGIMGTHLKLSKKRQDEISKSDNVAWRPEAMGEAISMIFRGPAKRQRMLDPDETDVDRYEPANEQTKDRHKNVKKVKFISTPGQSGHYRDPHQGADLDPQQAHPSASEIDEMGRLRGWSEVFFDSYGKAIMGLEQQLNQMCWLGQAREGWTTGDHGILSQMPSQWGATRDGLLLKDDELKKICDAWYPVHAVGYNWLKSNGESGKYVAQRIQAIMADYKQAGFKCEKVIVYTHSMGGLVARALIHPEYGNAASFVAGIVHGVMPATGAPAAYKRLRAGFEGGGIVGAITKRVLGKDGQEVTAVLANAPGGLQLLPSERYPSGWLKVEQEGKEMLSLPKADPYEEIYTVTDKWYRLINPAWVNPAKDERSDLGRTFEYMKEARKFHRNIGTTYHDTTYLSYGADPTQKAWDKVVWHAGTAPVTRSNNDNDYPFVNELPLVVVDAGVFHWHTQEDKGDGKITVQADSGILRVAIAPPADAADGTVPTPSAEDPILQGKPQLAFKQQGYDHQDSYKNKDAINATLYSIARIAHDKFDWWEN
jgi:hypothetical protein